ncbi:MAG: hypothetical protein IH840_17355 [Candidatus Heimdallarchaeota archaeon]|nr:hypothetical protein [Candidatus Heimdallarchaeota archaeon]
MKERYRELRESAEIRWNKFAETNPRLSRMIAIFTKISYRYGKSLGIFLAYFYIAIEILTFTVFLLNVIFAESYIIQGDIDILSSSVSLNSTVKFVFFFIHVIFYISIIYD